MLVYQRVLYPKELLLDKMGLLWDSYLSTACTSLKTTVGLRGLSPFKLLLWNMLFVMAKMPHILLFGLTSHGCQPKNREKTPKIMENPITMDDLGVPLFLETPTCFTEQCALLEEWWSITLPIAWVSPHRLVVSSCRLFSGAICLASCLELMIKGEFEKIFQQNCVFHHENAISDLRSFCRRWVQKSGERESSCGILNFNHFELHFNGCFWFP